MPHGAPGARSTCPSSACPEASAGDPAADLRRRGSSASASGPAARGYDRLVVYADREHSANLAYLTGFDPRFEEAMLVLGPERRPGHPGRQRVLRHGRRRARCRCAAILFQDLSLPSQPRDRSRPLAEILADGGHRRRQPGRRRRLEDVRATRPRSTRRPTSSTSCGALTGPSGLGRERHRTC